MLKRTQEPRAARQGLLSYAEKVINISNKREKMPLLATT